MKRERGRDMTKEEIIRFLQNNEIFSQLEKEEIEKILPFLHEEHIEQGKVIIERGSKGREFYLVKSGSVEVIKKEADEEQIHKLGVIEANGYFGEMAHLEEKERFATIQAIKPVDLLVVDLDAINKEDEKLYYKIIFCLAKKVSGRLRKTGQNLINSFKEKIKVMEASVHISRSLILIFILMALWFNFSNLVRAYPGEKVVFDPIFTSFFILLFAVATIYVIKRSKYPLSFYGITTSRWLMDSIEAIFYSIPVLLFILLLKWILIHYVEPLQGMHLIPFTKIGQNISKIVLFSGIYLVFSPLQELVVRSGIQSSFREFFHGRHRAFWAIIASNLLFNMLHTVKAFWLGTGSFFLGLYWGFLFEKQRSLIGVSVSHAFIGIVTFYIFDFDTIFDIVW